MRALFPALPFLLAVASPAQVAWSRESLEDALARAKTEKRVVVLAVNWDGERTNDEVVADHYKDQRLGKLSAATINLFVSSGKHAAAGDCSRVAGVTCDEHARVEKKARELYLKADEEGWLIAPQHVFISPEGKVLTSLPYRVTKAELEWAWVDALRKVDKAFPWELAALARAPMRLLTGGTKEPTPDDAKPPTHEEVAAVLARMKKGMDHREGIANVATLARSADDAAQKFLKQLLANGLVTDEQRANVLHQIGKVAPPEYWDEVAPYIAHKDDEAVRREAVVALEQLADPKAADQLVQRFTKEVSDPVKGEILRALGRTGGTNKKAQGLLQEVLTKQKPKVQPDALRVHAVLAGATLEDRAAAASLVQAALKDGSWKVRSAGAYVAAARRDKDLMPVIRAAVASEKEESASQWLLAAVGVLDGGDSKRFRDFLKDVAEEAIVRDRH